MFYKYNTDITFVDHLQHIQLFAGMLEYFFVQELFSVLSGVFTNVNNYISSHKLYMVLVTFVMIEIVLEEEITSFRNVWNIVQYQNYNYTLDNGHIITHINYI